MKKNLLIALAMLLVISASEMIAQTKFIAHRSHSGSNGSYTPVCSYNYGIMSGYDEIEQPDSIVTGIGMDVDMSWKRRAKLFIVDTVVEDPIKAEIVEPQEEVMELFVPVTPDTIVEPEPLQLNTPIQEQEPPVQLEEPGISEMRKIETVPAEAVQVSDEETGRSRSRDGSLLWLALALGIPAMGLVMVSVRRRDWNDIG